MTNRVRFEPKSAWQKRDCINNSAERKCERPSTLEAVVTHESGENRVRCCENDDCKARAAEIALLTAKRINQTLTS